MYQLYNKKKLHILVKGEVEMNKVVEELSKIGIVPVIALDDAKDAEPLAKALIEGGLPCAEVTFRTAAAEESIRIMAEKFPELVVGAGTVLTPEQADRAMNAGAKFIVSPGLNPKVVKHCLDKGYPIVPGTSNPSDVETAIELGLDVVKFFPAEAAGGLNMIKSMAAPYTNMKFMPTGGINAGNLKSYLDFGKALRICQEKLLIRCLDLKLDTLVSTYRAVKRQKTLQIHSIRCSALKRKSVTVQYFQEQALS